MKKRRLEKLLSSIFGSHIGHEHSEVVEGKEGTDKKIDKILKLIKAEEREDDPEIGYKLISLVEEFHEDYKSLYGRYDTLVEKLKKHAHHKMEMNGDLSAVGTSSDSDSSSSNSDGSSKSRQKFRKKHGTKFLEEQAFMKDFHDLKMQVEILQNRNQELEIEAALMLSKVKDGEKLAGELTQREVAILKLEEELGRNKKSTEALEIVHESLKQELEAIKLQHSDVSQRLRSVHEEKETLLSGKLHAETAMEALEIEKGLLEEGAFKLQNEKQILKQDLESLNKQIVDLNSQLMIINEENNKLNFEHSTSLNKIGEAEKTISDLKDEACMNLVLANEKSEKIMQLLVENEQLSLKIAAVDRKRNDSENALSALKDENLTLSSEISGVRAQLLEFEMVCEKLRSDYGLVKDNESKLLSINANLNEELRVKGEELNAMSLSCAEALEKLRMAEERHEVLNVDLNSLGESKSQLMTDYNILKQESETTVLKISKLQEMLKGMQEEMCALGVENETLNSEKFVVLNRLSDADKLIEGLTTERDALNDCVMKLQNEIVDMRLELDARATQIDNLCGKLATTDEEKSMVLSKLSETDKLVEELKIEKGLLNEEIMTLCDEIAALKVELESEVGKVANLGDQLSSANEENRALSSENMMILRKIEEDERTIEALKIEVQINLESANHKALENVDLLAESECLKRDLEADSRKITQLIEELNARKEDVSTLNDKYSKAELDSEEARKTVEELMMDFQLLQESESKLLVTVADLEQKLRERDEDNDALSWKYTESVDQYKDMEACVQTLLEDLEKQKEEMSQLLVDYEGMKEDFITADGRVSELEGILAAISEEKLELGVTNAAHLKKIEEFEKMVEDLQNETKHLNRDNSELGVRIDELSRKLEDVEDEKNTSVAENLVKVGQMQQVQSNLEKRLEEKGDEVSALQKELADERAEVSSKIKVMTEHADRLLVEIDLLRGQKNELEDQVRVLTDSLSESKTLVEEVEAELTRKLSDQEIALNEQKLKFEEMMVNHKLLEDQFQESCQKLETAWGTIEELEVKAKVIGELEMVGEEQRREIEVSGKNLKESIERLKCSEIEREKTNDEILKLNGQIEALDAQLLLSNQKLEAAENEQREKDESYKKRIEKLQEKKKQSEERVVNLLGKACRLESAFEEVKEAVEKQLERVGDLGLVFEEAWGLLHSKIFKCSGEIRAVEERLEKLILKKEELEHEKGKQITKLEYVEGISSTLKEEVEKLREKLASKEEESERLAKSVNAYKNMMPELQTKVAELEKENVFKDEKKREAIRQLCIHIEYHRENCKHLYQLLSRKLKG